LADNPHRLGKELDPPLAGVYSVRAMREWRVLYVIGDQKHRITAARRKLSTRLDPTTATPRTTPQRRKRMAAQVAA
jgi:mRNA-degrading endonuclease RelE of RelBE toxin-antitoxin system